MSPQQLSTAKLHSGLKRVQQRNKREMITSLEPSGMETFPNQIMKRGLRPNLLFPVRLNSQSASPEYRRGRQNLRLSTTLNMN